MNPAFFSGQSAVCAVVLASSVFASAADFSWPQWRGPKRDAVSPETGLLKQWPEAGPQLLWTAKGCGKGYSSLAIANGMIFTAGTSSNQTFVIAFDTSGKQVWKSPNGQPWVPGAKMSWAKTYDGSRATPTVDDGVVFHLNETGLLSAFDAKTGQSRWSLDVAKQFEAECPDYGYTESVLVDGDRVICSPGGKKGYVVALNKKTGAVAWANTDINEPAGFASLVPMEFNGIRQLVTLTSKSIVSVEAATGKLLWRQPFTNKRENNIPTPICLPDAVFATTGYGAGSTLVKLLANGKSITPKQIWATNDLDNLHGGVVMANGCVYGAGNENPAWLCIDVETGKVRYREKGVGMGSVVYADGMLYCLGENGTIALVTCTQDRYAPASSFSVPKGGEGKFWAQPAICNGRLYLRHADCLYAYDIKTGK